MVGNVESSDSIPTLHVTVRLAWGVDRTLTELVEGLEDDSRPGD